MDIEFIDAPQVRAGERDAGEAARVHERAQLGDGRGLEIDGERVVRRGLCRAGRAACRGRMGAGIDVDVALRGR
jgi:hypothetical protein